MKKVILTVTAALMLVVQLVASNGCYADVTRLCATADETTCTFLGYCQGQTMFTGTCENNAYNHPAVGGATTGFDKRYTNTPSCWMTVRFIGCDGHMHYGQGCSVGAGYLATDTEGGNACPAGS